MGIILDRLVVSSNGIYTFNVTDYIEGRNNLSICLYAHIDDYGMDESVSIYSKENPTNSRGRLPQIIWTYNEFSSNQVTKPNLSFIIGGIVAGIIGVGAVVGGITYTKRKKKHKTNLKKERQEPILSQNQNPYRISHESVYCQECGAKILDKERIFCSNCGTKIDKFLVELNKKIY